MLRSFTPVSFVVLVDKYFVLGPAPERNFYYKTECVN